jgi:hypothetical protein
MININTNKVRPRLNRPSIKRKGRSQELNNA